MVYLPGVEQYVATFNLGLASAAVTLGIKLLADTLLKLVRDNRPDLPPPNPPVPMLFSIGLPLLLFADLTPIFAQLLQTWERVADWGPQWFLVFSMLYVVWFHVANPVVKAHRE